MSTEKTSQNIRPFSGTFGHRLRRILMEKRMNRVHLAKKSGVNYRTLYRLYHDMERPQTATIGRIATALDVDPSVFYDDPESSSPNLNLVREEGPPVYEVKTKEKPNTVEEAVKVLAKQLAIPEQEVRKCVFDCALKHNSSSGSPPASS